MAVQFALFAFFFNRLIPFSGDILLPTVWIFDKKVVFGFTVFQMIEMLPNLYWALHVTLPTFAFVNDPWIANYWLMGTLAFIAMVAGIIQSASWGGWALKRKLIRKAPDLLEMV